MAGEYKLTPLSIVLRLHSVSELREIYLETQGEAAPAGSSHMQLVEYLTSRASFRTLMRDWDEKLYAHNTTVKVFKVLNDNKPCPHLIKHVQKSFGKTWEKVVGQGRSPSEIGSEGELIHITKANDKYYMLFAWIGRAKEIVEALVVKNVPQSVFSVAVWDDKKGILQVRGHEKHGASALKFIKYAKNGGSADLAYLHVDINDRDKFLKLKKLLSGKEHRGRFVHATDEVTDVTYTSQPHVELADTRKVRTLLKEGYDQHSAAIDFTYDRKKYVVWVGFTTGTFWLRAGDVTEGVLNYIQEQILKIK